MTIKEIFSKIKSKTYHGYNLFSMICFLFSFILDLTFMLINTINAIIKNNVFQGLISAFYFAILIITTILIMYYFYQSKKSKLTYKKEIFLYIIISYLSLNIAGFLILIIGYVPEFETNSTIYMVGIEALMILYKIVMIIIKLKSFSKNDCIKKTLITINITEISITLLLTIFNYTAVLINRRHLTIDLYQGVLLYVEAIIETIVLFISLSSLVLSLYYLYKYHQIEKYSFCERRKINSYFEGRIIKHWF